MLYASFNQKITRICVGTKKGFLIYSIDPFKCLYKSEQGGCSIVEILDETSIVATVGTGDHPTSSRRLVKIFDMDASKKIKEICRLPFETPVLSIKFNRKRLVIVLEGEIHIFNTENVSFLTKITTNPNPKGLVALSVTSSNSHQMLLAYGCSSGTLKGDLILYDPTSLERFRILKEIHNHPLQSIQFSLDGKLIATASEAGTLIKILPVFDEMGDRFSFRRGSQAADISSIAFNKHSTLLAVSSTNGTVHIFDMKDGQERQSQPKNTFSMIGDLVWGEEARSFTTVKLPQGLNNLVAFSSDSSRVFTITQDGNFCQWNLEKSRPSSWTSGVPQCKLAREDVLLSDLYFGDDEEQNEHDKKQ
uniref:Uncharacterized protein n=1 Tax=Arcella intermedia TaxID=1963864 RepID=A0A6B2L7M6_9EUKA